MEDQFNIYIDRLQDGEEEHIHEEFAPDFLDVHEADLEFHSNVFVEGTAQKNKGMLILTLSIHTNAIVPCVICNSDVQVPIKIDHFYHSEDLNSIKSGVYNLAPLVRETVLLEIPARAECSSEGCPEREVLKNFFKNSSAESQNSPFADL